MPIPIRKDVVHTILKKIDETGQGLHTVDFSKTHVADQELRSAELLGHLDYLNQNQYLNAEFTKDGKVGNC